MIEATPGAPYGNTTAALHAVEASMEWRRKRIYAALEAVAPGVRPVSVTAFPAMGSDLQSSCCWPRAAAGGFHARSAYLPDSVISPHPRFWTLTANIRRRRGERVSIFVPAAPDVDRIESRDVPRLLKPSTRPVDASAGIAAATTSATPRPSEAQDDTQSPAAKAASALGPLDTALDKATDVVSAAVAGAVPSDWVHMDAMGFGMGCCCLQITFRARDLAESRFLYDAHVPLAPLLLAASANTPVLRGKLVDTDTRWHVISASVDCRTPAERSGATGCSGVSAELCAGIGRARAEATCSDEVQAILQSALPEGETLAPPEDEHGVPRAGWQRLPGPAPAGAVAGGNRPLAKSRYSSVDCYLSVDTPEGMDDLPVRMDDAAYAKLVAAGVDERLAQHVAHLFVRDPLVLFAGATKEVDDMLSSEHFESLQSTNWQSVRWKPPPPDATNIGWRVEVRTPEAQITDFENAAFAVFSALLSRTAIFFRLQMYMPLSKVQANFETARTRSAGKAGLFWWPLCIAPDGGSTTVDGTSRPNAELRECVRLRWLDILLGHSGTASDPGAGIDQHTAPTYPGLIPYIFAYLEMIGCDASTLALVEEYLSLIADRAAGVLLTGAEWQRQVVQSHPEYAGDGNVSATVAAGLMRLSADLADGLAAAPGLLGRPTPLPSAIERIAGSRSAGAKRELHPPPHAGVAPKLRGASFAEEMSAATRAAMDSLVKRHTVDTRRGWESTPAFLDSLGD